MLPDFFDPIVLDKFMDTVGEIQQIIMHHSINVELWLGETSSCFGGGAPVLSSSYIAGFMQVYCPLIVYNNYNITLEPHYNGHV